MILAIRSASTATLRIPPGHQSHSVSICASTARLTIATSVSTSPLFVRPTSTVCFCDLRPPRSVSASRPKLTNTCDSEWQWEQLRVMKVGGNESATKYFQSHGGSAALASKDPKVKYTSNAAVKYKEELKRRAAADAQQSVYPLERTLDNLEYWC